MYRHPYKHKQVGHWTRTLIIGNKQCLFHCRMTVNVAIPLLLGGDAYDEVKILYLLRSWCIQKCYRCNHCNYNKDGISEYKQTFFSTINSDIQKFHNWLIENNCYHVCMESTGKYWIPVFNYLKNDIDTCFTHPKYVKGIKDSFKILFKTQLQFTF